MRRPTTIQLAREVLNTQTLWILGSYPIDKARRLARAVLKAHAKNAKGKRK